MIKLQRKAMSFEGGKKPTDLDAASQHLWFIIQKAKDEGCTKKKPEAKKEEAKKPEMSFGQERNEKLLVKL